MTMMVQRWTQMVEDDLWLAEVMEELALDGEVGELMAAGAALTWPKVTRLEELPVQRDALQWSRALEPERVRLLAQAVMVHADSAWSALESLESEQTKRYSRVESLAWERAKLDLALTALLCAGANASNFEEHLSRFDERAERFLETLPAQWSVDTEDQRELSERCLASWWNMLSVRGMVGTQWR